MENEEPTQGGGGACMIFEREGTGRGKGTGLGGSGSSNHSLTATCDRSSDLSMMSEAS